MKKVLAVFAALSLGCALFGCGGSKGAESAEELIKAYQEAGYDNYRLEGEVAENISVSGSGVEMEIPIEVTMSMDITKNIQHGEMALKASVFGQDNEQSTEIYIDSASQTVYAKSDSDSSWTAGSYENYASFLNIANESTLEDIAWSDFQASESGYTLKTTVGELYDTLGFDIDDLLGDYASYFSDAETGLSDLEVTYTFDSDYHPTGLSVEESPIQVNMEDSGIEYTMSMTLSMNYTFSDYGEVEDIEIPEEALEAVGIDISSDLDETEASETTEEDAEETTGKSTEKTTEASDEETTKAAASSGAGSDWIDYDDMSFFVNGTKYTLGVSTLQDMIDGGVPFDEEDIKNAGNNVNYYSSESFGIVLGDYWTASVYTTNYSQESKTASELVITSIYCPQFDDETQDIIEFAFPLDMTQEELVAACGEPTETNDYSGEGYTSITVEYQKEAEDSYLSYGYIFNFWNGALDYVNMDWLP